MTSDNVALNLSDSPLWAPYKSLFSIVNSAIVSKNVDVIPDLEAALKNHKPDFISLLKNPVRNQMHREVVKKASSTGIAINGLTGVQVLSQSLVDEALIISDMFDLNELTSLELLIAGQQQQPHFPGLTRGLVAMLLYYDGRRSLVNALHLLVQARDGRTWTLGLNPELSSIIMRYTNQLKEEGIIMKVIDIIEKSDIAEELQLLHKNRALGGPRYRKQVTELISEIKQSLAEVIFCWACQNSLSYEESLRLLNYLSKQSNMTGEGTMDEPTLTIALSLLYVMDVGLLQTCDEIDGTAQMLNLACVPDLAAAIHKQLILSQEKWQMPGLKSIFQLAWGISLRTMSQYPMGSLGINLVESIEDDERTVDLAVEDGAFQALRKLIVKSSIFHLEEFFVKRIHNLVTDFIVLMPLKVKELRNRGDETARIIAQYTQEGLEPPSHVSLHFEHLMNLVSDLYSKDPLGLDLASEYWCPTDNLLEQSFVQRPTQRQIALYKFVRLAGDLLPPPLFVPYHQMLTGLSNSPVCAHSCFSLLKMNGRNGNQCSLVSWDHFFTVLHRYYNSLHEEMPSAVDVQYSYPQRMHSKGITPQEVQGLISVLQLITQVVKLDEIARIALAENPQYVPTVVILGLITCSIPATLKSALIHCLAAFATSPEIALNIWQGLELAQVIPTIKTVSVYHPSGILMELEDVETRMEEYPVTKAMLVLLDALLNHPYPSALGSGTRQPGIEPYLQFVRDSVLLRCNSRSYKTQGEKWEVMSLCLKVLEKVLLCYRIRPDRISFNLNSDINLGISILSQMLQDSGLLRTVLFILDEGMRVFDEYASVPGQSHLEDCTLLSLKLIHHTLLKQESFLQQVRDSGCDLLVTSLDNLLLSINPRSGQTDHLFVIAKYVTYNTFVPEHSLYSINILYSLCSTSHIAQHLVGIFNSDQKENDVLLNGFVESLEVDVAGEQGGDKPHDDRNKARQQVLLLLLKCLRHPGPNLSHYLLGFNLRKSIAQTEIQEPGVMGSRRTCLHAVLSFLDSDTTSSSYPVNIYGSPRASELAYQLIYVLCTNKDTSGPTLRFLRSTHDFLYRHLQHLPFRQKDDVEIKLMLQQSWLLRTLAVELRVTSAHHQRSHVQRLLNVLLDDKLSIENGSVDVTLEQSFGTTNVSSYSFMKPNTGLIRRKLMRILDSIDFQHPMPINPPWEYFDNVEVQRILKACEMQEAGGPSLVNVEELHCRLSEEILGLHNASVLGQRPIMIQEISKVLEYAVSCNEAREAIYSKRRLFEAWRQVTEVLLIACPLEILGNEKKHQMVLEISQELLRKIMSEGVLSELMPPASGVILTLMTTLRYSMISTFPKQISDLSSVNNNASSAESPIIPLTHHSSLLVVLRSVVECLLKTGSGLQRVRANFYSAFLNLLCIVQKPKDIAVEEVDITVLDQESETKKLRLEYMDTILSFGETIMEIVCRDACTGHDITKMLSLAVLDVALSLDSHQQWLAFLVSKGYLRHILDSLNKDDEELQNLFNSSSNSFRIFYVFESKMALLTRIACSTAGALALLRNGAIHKLAECRSLDLRPQVHEQESETGNWIFPDLMKCYRQMFMSMMKLILSITVTLGASHREASLQVLEFVVCNSELFLHVIRDHLSLYSLEALEELTLMSSVLSRVTFGDSSTITSGAFVSEQQGDVLLLRRHFLMLLPRLIAVGNADARNQGTNDDPEKTAQMKMCRLQIASHVLGSCCSSIVKFGKDNNSCLLFFSPRIADVTMSDSYQLAPTGFQKKTPISIYGNPDLGLLITLLYRSATELQISINDHKLLMHRLSSITTLTSDELAEYLPSVLKLDQSTTVHHQREHAKASLQQLIKLKVKEISILSHMIESSAYILLKQLEYFLLHHKKEDTSILSQAPESLRSIRRLQGPDSSNDTSQLSSPVISEFQKQAIQGLDLEKFKTDVQSAIGEQFFRKLKSIEQYLTKGRSHVSFLEAIMHRLKRLVKIQMR